MPLRPGKIGLTKCVSAERRPSPCKMVIARRVQSLSGKGGNLVFPGLLHSIKIIRGLGQENRTAQSRSCFV
jgi:hypothetical protein